DAHAFRIVAVRAERRGAGGADPLLAAWVPPFFLPQALAKKLEQLVQPADRLDLLLLLFCKIFLGELLEPFRRNLGAERLAHQLQPLEHVAEDTVEFVEVAFVLHQRRAREIVEVLDPTAGEVLLHRLHQREIFAQGHRHAGGFELVEEGDEHGANLRRYASRSRLVSGDGSIAQPDRRGATAWRARGPRNMVPRRQGTRNMLCCRKAAGEKEWSNARSKAARPCGRMSLARELPRGMGPERLSEPPDPVDRRLHSRLG